VYFKELGIVKYSTDELIGIFDRIGEKNKLFKVEKTHWEYKNGAKQLKLDIMSPLTVQTSFKLLVAKNFIWVGQLAMAYGTPYTL
jgi:hypothetical protein